MTIEYVVLGAVLIVMGAVQIWLRYGSWAKEQREAQKEASDAPAEEPSEAARTAVERGTKVWNTWTAILGPLAIVFGIVLVVLGALGL